MLLPKLRTLVLLSTSFAVGCASTTVRVVPARPLVGNVHGGQQPISGVSIQLYAVGSSDKGQSIPLLAQAAVSGTDGSFSLGAYTCPANNPNVYLVGNGGNPGLATGANNPQSSLISALGACDDLSPSTYISVNEVSTVASLYPISNFAGTFASVGASPANGPALIAAFAEINNLLDVQSGTSPGQNISNGITIPTAAINALADSIASCVNSAGGVAGDGSACGNLFTLATPPQRPAPKNTADALIDIFQNPNNNVQAIFDLASAAGPYQPALTAPPTDWNLRPTPAIAAHGSLIGEYLLTEGAGEVAHDTSGMGNDATISGATWDGSTDLSFDSSGSYVKLPSASNAAQTFQFAIYSPPLGFAQLPLAPGYGDTSSIPVNLSLLCGTDMAHVCFISGQPGTSSRFQSINTDYTEASVPITPGWHIVSILCGNRTGGTVSKSHILYDGLEVSGYVVQGDAGTCPIPTSGNYQIGGSSTYYHTWFIGKLAAAWVWSTELSLPDAATAAATAQAYMYSKGIPTEYANAGNSSPLVLGGFDSRTRGIALPSTSEAWPSVMTLDKTTTIVNISSAGSTAFDWCAEYDLVYGQQIPPSPEGSVISALWGGVNDYLIGAQNAQQTAASLQCLVAKAKAHGSLVILATEISFISSQTPQGDQFKDALDAIIRANAFSWGVDSIADLATDPTLGADGASSNTNCFPDGLHPSVSCEQNVASIMQNAINELNGSTSANPNITAADNFQEAARDRFLVLSGTAAQTITLPDCTGYSLSRNIINNGSVSAIVGTVNAESLSGSATVSPGSTAILTPIPGPLSAGGCSWSRTQ